MKMMLLLLLMLRRLVALLLLLNPQAASPQAVVEWAAPHRAALLASFLRFARGVVGEG